MKQWLLGLLLLLVAPTLVLAQARLVRVGVYQNEPKIFVDADGKPSGIFVDLLDQIATVEGWQIEYVPCAWAACLAALEAGELDLMPDVAYSAERDRRFDFHTTPVLESWSRVYAAPGVSINRLADLDGKRIAILEGSIQQAVFAQLMAGFGYQVAMIPADSFEQALNLAANGTADGAITNQLFGDYFYQSYGLSKTTIDFNPVDLYYATTAGRNADLLTAIDRDLQQWTPEPNSPYYTTLGHWVIHEPAYQLPETICWSLVAILGLLGFSACGNLLLRRQVRQRTAYLQQANAELQASQQRYLTLTRISPVGIFHTDTTGSTIYVNPRWCEIAGIPAEQTLGEGWIDAVHPDDREALVQGWQQTKSQQAESRVDYRFLRPDGTIAWAMGQAVPELNSQNQLIGYLGTITDITERKLAEEELRRLNNELEERVARRTEELKTAMQRAMEADRLKSVFLATMSHELRTPLNSIIGFTGILLQGLAGPLNAEQHKQLGIIYDSARHLLALINDVLDISKIEAEQLELSHAPFEMRTAIEESLRLVLPQAQKKGLNLTVAIATNVGVVVSDRRRVEQILLNLLSNAVKFTEQGDVQLSCRAYDDYLETCVHDTGIGIRSSDLAQLFKPFHQLETGLNRHHEGTGLGLAICHNLVGLLGGTIRVTSEWGAGSCFCFTLPLTEGATHGQHTELNLLNQEQAGRSG